MKTSFVNLLTIKIKQFIFTYIIDAHNLNARSSEDLSEYVYKYVGKYSLLDKKYLVSYKLGSHITVN